ncbi:BTB and MATH domain-containing protein 36-like [Oculina patagonica]
MSKMAAKRSEDDTPPDFAHPWLFSDAILVAERQKFHVHRSTLAMCSPVFEKMFTSEFKEKNLCEIPLPGKKASEIKELLLVIYRTMSGKAWKTVTNENCYFLAKLAHEYQIDAIFQSCEDVLVKLVSSKYGNGCLDDLTFAQTYKLEKLLKTIIDKARKLRLSDFKRHAMYDKMEAHIYKQILEGMVARLEGPLQNAQSRGYYYD